MYLTFYCGIFKLYPHRASSGSGKIPLECIVMLQNRSQAHFQTSGERHHVHNGSNVFNGTNLPLDAWCGYILSVNVYIFIYLPPYLNCKGLWELLKSNKDNE